MTPSRKLVSFAGGTVPVEADAATLCWLEEFCAPCFLFDAAEPGGPTAAKLRLVIDAARFDALCRHATEANASPFACFALDSGTVYNDGWRAADAIYLHDSRLDCFYRVADTAVDVIARPDSANPRLALLRVLREVLVGRARRTTVSLELHAAAFVVDGRAVVVAGGKGAGKTTALCRALAKSRAFLTNDRLFLRPDGEHILAYGIPTVVRLRPATRALFADRFAGFPESASQLTRREAEDRKTETTAGSTGLQLSAAQFCDRFAAPASPSARLSSIVVLDPHSPGSALRNAEEPPEALIRSCFYGGGGAPPDTLFAALLDPHLRPGVDGSTSRLIDRLGHHVVALEPDLAALLAAVDADVEMVTPITTRPGKRSSRASYRIDLKDGTRVKARRGRGIDQHPKAWQILECLGTGNLSEVLVASGDCVLERWVDGTPLDAASPAPQHIREAARILAVLHATDRIGDDQLPRSESTDAAFTKLESDLRQLVTCKALRQNEEAALLRRAEKCMPETALFGVTHNDFCAENMVVDSNGQLFLVDNEAVSLWYLDHDLARTRYRWPLSEPEWDLFLQHYATFRPQLPSVSASRFWLLTAAARSARVRNVNQMAGADAALAQLQCFLDPDAETPSLIPEQQDTAP